jgi:uncharacterized phage infection (PIP) family protein YhgE
MAQAHAIQMDPSTTDGTTLPAEDVVLSEERHENSRHSGGAKSVDQGAGNVDKIRNILFGSQMREYEARFVQLEESVAEGLAELREMSNKRFEALETYVRNEFESLQARTKSEREDRTNGLKQVARDLTELGEGLNRRISELDEQGSQAQRQLRLELLQLSKSFSEDVGRKQEEMNLLVDRRFQELRKAKTDRAALAAMFTELGMRLNDEFQVPGTER